MIAAAGNNYGGDCEYPAAYDEVIGVGAININGNYASFTAIDGVDVWAPGEEIFSSYANASYQVMNGTSMVAPHYVRTIMNYINKN